MKVLNVPWLRLENLRLLALTQAQNARLENNNQELERKVMLRTSTNSSRNEEYTATQQCT